MRRGRMNNEAPLGALGETHSVGKGTYLPQWITGGDAHTTLAAPTISPRSVELPPHLAGANPYRPDYHPPPQGQIFEFDLDLNPDL